MDILSALGCRLLKKLMSVDEIASFSVHAAVVLLEILALLRFVLVVHLVVLQQLMGPVCKFAPCLIGTESEIHEAAT
jgi:hypothetical protein